jgi:hypothetical protein
MASKLFVDEIESSTASGISVVGEIKLSTGKAIKNAAGTALLTEAGALDNVALGSSVTGINTPNFMVRLSGSQSIDNAESATKILFDTEDIDSGGKFASNKFTPTVAGIYFISCTLGVESNTNASTSLVRVTIYKGSGAGASSAIDGVSARVDYRTNKGRGAAINCNCLVELDSDDYIEGFAFNTASTGTSVITSSNTMMCGFKLL